MFYAHAISVYFSRLESAVWCTIGENRRAGSWKRTWKLWETSSGGKHNHVHHIEGVSDHGQVQTQAQAREERRNDRGVREANESAKR